MALAEIDLDHIAHVFEARADDPPGILSKDTLLERVAGVRGDHDLNQDVAPGRNLRPAAVLLPIVDRGPDLTVLLTRRTDHLHHHAGQISFPGGRVDAEDADHVATALRETEEEVGLPRDHVNVIGRLDTYITGTGFSVTPVVGLIKPPFPVKPDPFEVAEVFEVPLAFLLDPNNHQVHSREFRGQTRRFFALPYFNYYIWGATAGMLVHFSRLILGTDGSLGGPANEVDL